MCDLSSLYDKRDDVRQRSASKRACVCDNVSPRNHVSLPVSPRNDVSQRQASSPLYTRARKRHLVVASVASVCSIGGGRDNV